MLMFKDPILGEMSWKDRILRVDVLYLCLVYLSIQSLETDISYLDLKQARFLHNETNAGLGEQKCTEISFEKVPDVFNLG